MNWSDKAIIISTRKQGENSLLVSVLTENHGLHSGMVSSAKKYAAICQPCNFVHVSWNARLEEHLGFFTCESLKDNAHIIMFDKLKLHAVNSICSLLSRVMQEREVNRQIYNMVNSLIENIISDDNWLEEYVFFELHLLSELGYGLDLDKCAVTGEKDSLYYVSPKTGRAVTKEIGEPYKDKLLRLPYFMNKHKNINGTLCRNNTSSNSDLMEIIDGISLTRYFFNKCVFSFDKRGVPTSCNRFVQKILESAENV